MAQREVAVRLGAAQVEIAVAQARFFGGVNFVFDGNGGVLALFRMWSLVAKQLDFAGGELGIRFLPLR